MSNSGLRLVEIAVKEAPSLGNIRVPAESVYEVYRPVQPPVPYRMHGRLFVCFGTTGAFGRLLIDVESGNIVEMHGGDSNVNFVNSSVGKFVECLESFSLLLLNGGDSEAEELACELESVIRRLDPNAYREGSFWYELRWSVDIGDFD